MPKISKEEIDLGKEYYDEIEKELSTQLQSNNRYMEIGENLLKTLQTSLEDGNFKVTHYIIELLENISALQSQRESTIKDMFNLKKAILDFAYKATPEIDNDNVVRTLQEILRMEEEKRRHNDKNKTEEFYYTTDDIHKLDEEIDRVIESDN